MKQGTFTYNDELVDFSSIKYIWGLDVSLESTGLAIFDFHKDKFVVIDHCFTKKIKTDINVGGLEDLPFKLHYIAEFIQKYYKKYPPSMVALERPFLHPKQKATGESLYRVHGVINTILRNHPQIYYPPKTLKAVIIKGDMEKTFVKHSILLEFPEIRETLKAHHINYGTKKKPKWFDEDESDAISACVTLMDKLNLRIWEKKSLKDVRDSVEEENRLHT